MFYSLSIENNILLTDSPSTIYTGIIDSEVLCSMILIGVYSNTTSGNIFERSKKLRKLNIVLENATL